MWYQAKMTKKKTWRPLGDGTLRLYPYPKSPEWRWRNLLWGEWNVFLKHTAAPAFDLFHIHGTGGSAAAKEKPPPKFPELGHNFEGATGHLGSLLNAGSNSENWHSSSDPHAAAPHEAPRSSGTYEFASHVLLGAFLHFLWLSPGPGSCPWSSAHTTSPPDLLFSSLQQLLAS